MATRTQPRVAVPMGAKWDPDLSVKENAQAAWERALETIRAQSAQQMRLGLRRAFALVEFDDVQYLDRYPRVPIVEIGDEKVAYRDGSLLLVEFCGGCGEEMRGYKFATLAQFGEALDHRDASEDFTCDSCWRQSVEKKQKGWRSAA